MNSDFLITFQKICRALRAVFIKTQRADLENESNFEYHEKKRSYPFRMGPGSPWVASEKSDFGGAQPKIFKKWLKFSKIFRKHWFSTTSVDFRAKLHSSPEIPRKISIQIDPNFVKIGPLVPKLSAQMFLFIDAGRICR